MYTVQVSEDLNGIGRFYIHTTAKSLSTDEVFNSATIKVYAVQSDIVVEGVYDDFTMTVFNTVGAEVFKGSFVGEGLNRISVSSLPTAVYIVRIDTTLGSKNKKMIINKQ